jgi:hypothetical protein
MKAKCSSTIDRSSPRKDAASRLSGRPFGRQEARDHHRTTYNKRLCLVVDVKEEVRGIDIVRVPKLDVKKPTDLGKRVFRYAAYFPGILEQFFEASFDDRGNVRR